MPEVWLIDPMARTVQVFAPNMGSLGSRELAEGATYRPGESVKSSVLAGLALEVADLFPHRTD